MTMNKIEIIDEHAMIAMKYAVAMTKTVQAMRDDGKECPIDNTYVSDDSDVVFFAKTMFSDDDADVQRLGRSLLMEYMDIALEVSV